MEDMRRQKSEAMLQKRQEYVEKTKNVLLFGDMPSEKTTKKNKKVRSEQYLSESGSDKNEDRPEAAPREKKRKRKRSADRRERKSSKKGRKKRHENDESGGKNESPLTI